MTPQLHWKTIAEEKRKTINDAIPAKWRLPTVKDDMFAAGFLNTHDYLNTILPEPEVSITESTLLALAESIKLGQRSSVDIVSAFCHRAALAHQILNCCSDIFFDTAMERARELDEHLAKTGKPVGPLHGIPISLKDQVDLEGKDSTLGYVKNVNNPKSKNSLIADLLLQNGAVLFCKTTVPISLMPSETESNLFGYTLNAINFNMTSGGSSGGEGALIGAGASILGFGTDIGGSIRIPLCFQGLYGLKPSNGRFSYMNVTNSLSGQEAVSSAIGPMGRSIEDIQFISKLLIDSEAWNSDPKVLQKPWCAEKRDKFTIGVWHFEKHMMPHPPILRAVAEVKEALIHAGHEVVDIDIPMLDDIINTVYKVYYADAGVEFRADAAESGEPIIQELEDFLSGSPFSEPLTVNQWFDVCNEAYKLKQGFLQFWQDTLRDTPSKQPIDAIVCPIWPSASFLKHGPESDRYCAIFNLLDCSCAALPVTHVDKTRDAKSTTYIPKSKEEKAVYDMYDPEAFHGMPVVLQVVTRKLEEERALAVAVACDKALKSQSK